LSDRNQGPPPSVNVILTERMTPTFAPVVGKDNVLSVPPRTVAEDFSYYQQQVAGLFFHLVVTPNEADPNKVQMLHSPQFSLDERALLVGVRRLARVALAGMEDSQP